MSLLLLAVAGGPIFWWWRRNRSRQDQPDTAGVVLGDATASADVALSVEQSEGAWSRHPIELTPAGKLVGLMSMSEGYVGFGETTGADGDERAAVWASPDGLAWEALTILDPGRASIGLPWRGGLLVLGSVVTHPFTACAWWSDDGRSWRQLTGPDDPILAGVTFDGAAASHGVVVAFGRGVRGPGAWASTDARAWELSALRGGIDLVAAVADGFVAFGRHLDERRPLLALSPDGLTWAEPSPDSLFMFEGIALAVVESFGGGLVAAGTDKMKGAATVWVSDDGTRWHRTPFDPDPGTSIEHLVLVGERLVAVGSDAGRRRTGRPGSVAVWESTDAVTWERTEAAEIFTSAQATGLVVGQSSVLIAGTLVAGHGSPWPGAQQVIWEKTSVQAELLPFL